MSEPNLIDFLMTILNGIEYGSLSTTNRAYQWMKNNSSQNGPCLTLLKNYISNENLITLKEMELFKKLEKEGDLPSEEDIDKEMEAYFSNEEINEFELINSQNHSDILKHASNFLKEQDLADKFLRRKQNDLEVKIKTEERRREHNESEMRSAYYLSDEINISYNEILKNIRSELAAISINFDKLLRENSSSEEPNIFQINFEIFKQINSTFRDTVRVVMEKQFSNAKQNVDQYDLGKEDCSANDDGRKYIENLIRVAHCFGERSFQNLKYQCEEVEFQQVSEFLTKLTQDIQGAKLSIVGNAQLQSQTAVNLETVDNIQKKLSIMSENLEQYYKNFIVHEIFNDERNRIESKVKSDKKRLRKVLDLCAKFVDLLTLQAFLLENEKDNVDLAIDMYHKAISTLETHFQTHSNSIFSVRKILENLKTKTPSDPSLLVKFGADLLKIDEQNGDLSVEKILHEFSAASNDLMNKIRTLSDQKLNSVGLVKNNLNRLDEVLFSGPVRQPFFRGSLTTDKRIIESRCAEFTKIFRSLKKDYKEELERLSADEFVKMEKSLWIMFLADPKHFQEKLQKLREKAGLNKTLLIKKTESLSMLVKKSNCSSYY